MPDVLTQNDCYRAGVKIKPCGVMVHSTGANNPTLRRYVQPDATTQEREKLLALLGKNTNGNHWNQTRQYIYTDGTRTIGTRDYSKKLKQTLYEPCVHGFIGKLADGSIAACQTLPWNSRGWHSGYATKQSVTNANKLGYIGFEICEDGLTDPVYFAKVYREAVGLTAYLCRMYNLDPRKDGTVICHSEGYKRGIASNHKDVMHWFPRHGKDMNTFRADVIAEWSKNQDAEKEDEDVTRYNKISDMPAYARPTIIKLVDKGFIGGSGKVKDVSGRPADLDLSQDMIRGFIINDRAGLYG